MSAACGLTANTSKSFFDFLGDTVHGHDRFDRIFARRRFRRQHDRIGAVINGRGDVGGFGARRHRARDHRFQHLGCDDGRLAGAAAGTRHLLLHAGHLFERHLPPRSPRATISASASSRCRRAGPACGFSILAITAARPRVTSWLRRYLRGAE